MTTRQKPAQRARQRRATRRDGRAAFTLVELLVVIAVIGLLVVILVMVAGKVMQSHKVRATENIMRTIHAAIDQFASVDPLKSVYNRRSGRTFGNFPPYQLAGDNGAVNSVAYSLEPFTNTDWTKDAPRTLDWRLMRDLGNANGGQTPNWVNIETEPQFDRANDDIRALYTYLRLYASDAVSQVPEQARKELPNNEPEGEYVNTRGAGGAANAHRRTEVLGFYDAWGVPLDYFLHVKLERGIRANGVVGWVVADRIPVLRSHGVPADVFEVQREAYTNDTKVFDRKKWVFSTPFPTPAAQVDATGTFTVSDPSGNGWVRAVAGVPGAGGYDVDDYGYIPDQDR
ncbi:MAG: type II secretion system GspH family protein [Planctomycetes bacterium]|nr:type II secretion system GspH family protein [Planctomycetota bacterium]